MENPKFFYCYNIELKRFLVENNYGRTITYALHPKTKLEFWQFLITERLQQGLKTYKSQGKSNGIPLKNELSNIDTGKI